jgi:sterol desaturase/sphingolipid hydroxylase (fatty acid hydroxylase superfamily)
MPVNYIVLAIPVFFFLIGVEVLIARLVERDYYRWDDALSNLSCGMIQQLLEVLVKTALFAGYLLVYRYRLLEIGTGSALAWLLCFLGVDFLYYWFHRLSHEVNVFWAAHVVHHQSEEYNLAVALRQGALQGWFSWAFYLPLALVGFPPLMFLAVSSFHTLYQFWIHTRAIGRLGPLEWILNTPSNHRVHHGRNPKYVDRNHGGTLIVWDRLFGTYVPEEEEPAYGITRPLRSWNPVWANVHYWVELVGKARQAARVSDALRLFVARPGWQPPEMGGYVPPPEVDPAQPSYASVLPGGLGAYVLVQFMALLVATSVVLWTQARLSPPLLAGAVVALGASLGILGGLLDLRGWAISLELARVALLGTAAALALRPLVGPVAGVGLGAGIAAPLGLWLASYLPNRRVPSAPATSSRSSTRSG